MNKKEKLAKEGNSKGITLIALVVTIIILIILAGVSISLVLGENGIIEKARLAKIKTQEASLNEQLALNQLPDYIENLGEITSKEPTEGGTNTSLTVSIDCTLEDGYFTMGTIVSVDVVISGVTEENYPLTIEYYIDEVLYDTQTLTTGTTANLSDISCSKVLVKVIDKLGNYTTAERSILNVE